MATTVVRPRKLSGRGRKGVLVVHIGSAGAWIGIDIVLAVLIFTAMLTDEAEVAATSLRALELFAVWPMLASSLVCLTSGVVLGLGSKYGLVRYWWVAAKLVINVGMSALIVFALRPGLGEAAVYGEQLAAGNTAAGMPSSLLFPPIVSPTLLLIALVLSVLKPRARIPTRSSPAS